MKNYFKSLSFKIKPYHYLALLVALAGVWLLYNVILRSFGYMPNLIASFDNWKIALALAGLLEIPRGLLGVGLILMSFGLLLRARVAWVLSILLLIGIIFISTWTLPNNLALAAYALVLLVLLIIYRKYFDLASIAVGTLFALISFISLSSYAVFGTLYLGEEFKPHVTDIQTAIYFSFVAMSTVGFGDIVPITSTARLFTVSVITMGITVFATSISVIIGPLIGGNIKKIFRKKGSYIMRKDHYIIAGATPLAVSIYNGLQDRGIPVTVVVPVNTPYKFPDNADILIGDPTDTEQLTKAGAQKAQYILALGDNDAENAFVILAAKEVTGTEAKTIAALNTVEHLQKMKSVQPDFLFSLQLLGSELLVRTLQGEEIDNKLVTEFFFTHNENVK